MRADDHTLRTRTATALSRHELQAVGQRTAHPNRVMWR